MQLGGPPPDETLPALRVDLELSRAGHTGGGAPSYTIHDPLAGRYYRIGWLQFEILSHWRAGATPAAVVEALRRRPFLQADEEDVKSMLAFLRRHQLVQPGPLETAQLAAMAQARKTTLVQFALKNYLYLKIPLVRPDRFLGWAEPRLRFLFTPGYFIFIGLLALLGILLIAQDWVGWFASFAIVKTPAGLTLTFLVLLLSKMVHEFGHGLVAKHYGCRVPRMGLALILMWPVLWTDTTDAWRIPDNRKRLMIDAAGMMAELSLAVFATVLWALAPDGIVKSALHILSGVAWVMTLAVNASPLMRFDGYYILADLVDIPNLQERAFAHMRWWLRRRILWSDEPPPEQWPPRTARFLRLYALACWLYRLVLFTSIALVVYHYFFKLMGLVLFGIEIWFFVARPIVAEGRNWVRQIRGGMPPVLAALLAVVVLGIVLAALPVYGGITAPAYARAPYEYLLETPLPARLQEDALANGQRVAKGDKLAVLDAPDISYRLSLSDAQAASLRAQARQSALGSDTYQKSQLQGGEALTKQAEAAGYRASQDRLTLYAQADGVIRDVPADLNTGDWLSAEEPLGVLVAPGAMIEAFVTEEQLARLALGQEASVSAQDAPQLDGQRFVIVSLGANPVDALPYPELSAENKGPVTMRPPRHGQPPAPAVPLFRVLLQPRDAALKNVMLAQSGPVTLHIDGRPHSPLMAFLRRAAGVIVREAGF